MHLILTGATGLVGSAVLDAMLKNKDVTRISILSRRPVPMAEKAADPRVGVILHKDFTKYDADVLGKLRGASGVVWALGVSQNAVSKEEYVRITKDYAIAAATSFADLAPGEEPFRFVFVSGEGATQTPGLTTAYYGRIKGETETRLDELRASGDVPRLQPSSARPSFVDPSDHADIQPFVPKLSPVLNCAARVLGPVLRQVDSWNTPTEPLGRCLTEMAMGKFDGQLKTDLSGVTKLDGGMPIISNAALRRLVGI